MANPEPAVHSLPEHPEQREGVARAEADARLAALLREDPQRAAPAVYDRFQADVNRWVWRLMGADPDHNDVVQQVFVRVIRSAKRLRDVERLAAWVHAIAANTVYGELRRREIRRLFLREQSATSLHADLVRDVEVRDLLLRAKAVIDKIPAKQRIVFVLHVVEGRTLTEIAELSGYSTATAKRRFGAANQRFQKLLAKDPELSRSLGKRTEDS
jgi:RNA polymerase sigma factor (sigma-70 family)